MSAPGVVAPEEGAPTAEGLADTVAVPEVTVPEHGRGRKQDPPSPDASHEQSEQLPFRSGRVYQRICDRSLLDLLEALLSRNPIQVLSEGREEFRWQVGASIEGFLRSRGSRGRRRGHALPDFVWHEADRGDPDPELKEQEHHGQEGLQSHEPPRRRSQRSGGKTAVHTERGRPSSGSTTRRSHAQWRCTRPQHSAKAHWRTRRRQFTPAVDVALDIAAESATLSAWFRRWSLGLPSCHESPRLHPLPPRNHFDNLPRPLRQVSRGGTIACEVRAKGDGEGSRNRQDPPASARRNQREFTRC